MLGIIIITYNIPANVLLLQIRAIKKFCTDPYRIIIVDNSFKKEAKESIAYHVGLDSSISLIHTQTGVRNGSNSHTFAANTVYSMIKNDQDYDTLLFLDHDCIPVKSFSVQQILGENLYAGLGHGAKATYLWPGLFMLRNAEVNRELVDFSTNAELGLDTGGNLYKLIEHHGKDKAVFLDEVHVQNTEFNGPAYNQYALLANGTFVHFINGSNWAHAAQQQGRINSLVNLVTGMVDAIV